MHERRDENGKAKGGLQVGAWVRKIYVLGWTAWWTVIGDGVTCGLGVVKRV